MSPTGGRRPVPTRGVFAIEQLVLVRYRESLMLQCDEKLDAAALPMPAALRPGRNPPARMQREEGRRGRRGQPRRPRREPGAERLCAVWWYPSNTAREGWRTGAQDLCAQPIRTVTLVVSLLPFLGVNRRSIFALNLRLGCFFRQRLLDLCEGYLHTLAGLAGFARALRQAPAGGHEPAGRRDAHLDRRGGALDAVLDDRDRGLATFDRDRGGLVDFRAVLADEGGGHRELLPAETVVRAGGKIGPEDRVGRWGSFSSKLVIGASGTDRKMLDVMPFLMSVLPSRISVTPSPWSTISRSGNACPPCEDEIGGTGQRMGRRSVLPRSRCRRSTPPDSPPGSRRTALRCTPSAASSSARAAAWGGPP